MFVVYNLPNRDCAAAGLARRAVVDKNGEARYQTEFIDVIAAAFKAHPCRRSWSCWSPIRWQPGDQHGGADLRRRRADLPPRHGVRDRKLSMPNVYIYVDGAHAGWLGWPKNLPKGAQLFKEVLAAAGGADRIRGFALNVSNYDPPRDPKARRVEPRRPEPGRARLRGGSQRRLAKLGITGKGFIIDTSRNGKA